MLKHLGSTIAIIVGVLQIGTIASQPQGEGIIIGPVMILGALAYRSCKRRGLGEVRSTWLRKGLEILALVAAVLLIVLQNDFIERLYYQPFSNIVPIVWALIAYGVGALRKYPAKSAMPVA
jgi:hypothetical protein